MEITGNVIAVLPAHSGVSQRSGNPRRMCFGIFGEERIKQFNLHQGEQNITVQFDIDAREYNGRWYNEIRAYNIVRPYTPQVQTTAPAAPVEAPPF
jgi:hypothetical protein